MNFFKQLFNRFVSACSTLIGKINWRVGEDHVMTDAERDVIRQKLKDNYYIILTRHNGHLSTYAINIAHWFIDGNRGYYAHALMNLEDEVDGDEDYRFIEATGKGVHYSGFTEVFDGQNSAVALLKPKCLTLTEWTDVMDYAKQQLGKPYDTLFNIADDQALSCVELVRVALSIMPTYAEDFANFEKTIVEQKNFDPQTLYYCKDFEVVYEVRH